LQHKDVAFFPSHFANFSSSSWLKLTIKIQTLTIDFSCH